MVLLAIMDIMGLEGNLVVGFEVWPFGPYLSIW